MDQKKFYYYIEKITHFKPFQAGTETPPPVMRLPLVGMTWEKNSDQLRSSFGYSSEKIASYYNELESDKEKIL